MNFERDDIQCNNWICSGGASCSIGIKLSDTGFDSMDPETYTR